MVNPSNLYAEKIFSEHPLAMWSFDDNIKYLSLLTDANRDLTSGWTFTNTPTATAYDETTYPYYKLGTTVTQLAKSSVTTSGTFTATMNSTINPGADTFTIGFYYFKTTPYISSIRIGYKVGITTTWSSSITTSEFYEWAFASATFAASPTNLSIVIEFNYAAPTSSDTVSILINGLTAGNLAEDANMISLGSQRENLPATLGISPDFYFDKGIRVSRYNSSSDLGYVIAGGTVSYGKNASFPMTFGSESVLVLSPNEYASPDPAPSLVVPAHGFLNESDKYKTRTFEAWIRVKAQTTEPRRIIGPISGTNGLYVDGATLVLSIGNNRGSVYVGEWDRPMLIQITTSINSAKLFLNGETVISLAYDSNDITFASYYKTSPATYDWIGFYAYSDVPRLEVDCVAIYAYEVDSVLALRRFVYAQGVDFPTSMITTNGGEAIIPDYSVANYTNNYTFGDGQKYTFSSGDIVNNANILSQRLSVPKYKLPEIRLEPGASETSATLLADQSGTDYLDLQPTSGWNDIESHLYFDKLSQIQDSVKAFYIVATRSEANASKQILFKVFNKLTENYLEAYTITSGGNNNIVYSFSYNGTTSTLATVSGNVIGTKFGAGIDIDALIAANSSLGTNISEFFSNQEVLSVYVGGDEAFTTDTTFTGKIYKLGFSNTRNLSKIDTLFTNGRFSGSASTLDAHTASYTLITKAFAGNVFLDISVNSYWQESVPLMSLAKFIGGQNLLDYLQINIDYPRPITFSSGEYDTDLSAARLYVTFQDSLDTPSDILDFSSFVRVESDNVIENTTGYATTAYEMVDGTVIYIPAVDIDSYFAVLHLEINAPSIITNRFSIKNIQIASQALSLDSVAPTEIGTKLGAKLLSYGATGSGNNPIVLPKENDNHLYLSSNSGMLVAGTVSSSRGQYVDINLGESSAFDIGLIQATMKFPMEAFSTSDVLLFEVVKEDATAVKFYIDSINSANNRAKVFAKNAGGSPYTTVEYFINGIKTEYPVVSLDEWVTLGIRFIEHFNIASQTAKIKICGPMFLNSLFYSQLKAGDEASKILTISRWANVLYNGNTSEIWDDYDSGYWSNVYTISASSTEINGLEIQDVYESFVGTQKIIAAYDATATKLKTKSYQYVAYIGSSSDTITSAPL
jgi:hypothetical protein